MARCATLHGWHLRNVAADRRDDIGACRPGPRPASDHVRCTESLP